LTDLLVEPMPSEGHFEYMRQRAAALKKPLPEPPKQVYAVGSLEWERDRRPRKATDASSEMLHTRAA